MAGTSWAQQMMQRFPNLFKSGYYLNPKARFIEDGPHYHDFDIFSPEHKKIGSASTSYDHVNAPGKITTENVEAGGMHGQPWSVGRSGLRDLGRQLNLYYEQQYPGHQFPEIGGIRVSGARVYGPVDPNYAGIPPKVGEMATRFKPAIAVPFAFGAMDSPFKSDDVSNDWSRASPFGYEP